MNKLSERPSLEAPAPSDNSRVDIGILTIRDDEFRAVLECFAADHAIYRGRHREYTLRSALAGDGQQYRIAILRQVEQGNGEAQEAARDLVDDLQPSLVLLVGIAGGLPSDDLSLGDVVLSTRILDFSVEARKFEDHTTYNVGGGPIAKQITAGIANLSAREKELGTWWSGLPDKPKVVLTGKNTFYGNKNWKRHVREKVALHYGPGTAARPPIFATGPIASSDRLIKDPLVLLPWISAARGILALEMESAGVHRATRDRTPMLAIRGISDIVGLKRQDAWTKYACASAAHFASAYLRTRPVPLQPAAEPPSTPAPASRAPVKSRPVDGLMDEAFSNLVPLRHFPDSLFVSPALCGTPKHGWAMIRKGQKTGNLDYVPPWALYEKNIYSFFDPAESKLNRIVDAGGIDRFKAEDWAFSKDPDKRRLFVYLLNAALRDDLWAQGVRFHADHDVYAFMGSPNEPPRRLNYANLKVRSTVTVVSHYEAKPENGKKYKYFRHSAFQGRFRLLGGQWHLEITPTYRFTRDGKEVDRFHASRLSGIKRLERNRSVLSQLLLWQAVLRAPWAPTERSRILEFAPLVSFKFPARVDEAQLTAVDAPAVRPSSQDEEIDP